MTGNKWNALQEFKDWWMKNGCPIIPPFENPIHCTDIAYALCIYRSGRFQVELYVVKPNTETTRHSHPNIESISMYLTGNMSFAKENGEYIDLSALQKETENGTHVLFGSVAESNDGQVHSLKVGPEGGAFLIFEFWKDRDPVSVTVHWEGDLVGDQHAQTKGNYVVNS
jgi:hypothetical protein